MENNCKCKTCKHLKGILKPTDKTLSTAFICMANENCFIDITNLLEINLGECLDYEPYDKNILENTKEYPIEIYDYEKIENHKDCTNCSYFNSDTIKYPNGICDLDDDRRVCGLGCYCELFISLSEKPHMNTKIDSNLKDLQKLALQVQYLRDKGEDDV